jgi:hypothetical protein
MFAVVIVCVDVAMFADNGRETLGKVDELCVCGRKEIPR